MVPEIKTVAVNATNHEVSLVFYTSDDKNAAECFMSVRMLRDNLPSVQFRVTNERGKPASAAEYANAVSIMKEMFAEAKTKGLNIYQFVSAIANGEIARMREEVG